MEIIASARYDRAHEVFAGCIDDEHPGHIAEGRRSLTEKADDVILNRQFAIPIFAGIMFLMYYFSIQTVGTMGTDFINDKVVREWIYGGMQNFLTEISVDSQLIGLICNGIVIGVGSVIGFLPQILCLFLCLALLEEAGYMARVAYMLDRLFCHFGLSGQSVIPIVIGTGCSVPAVMGARTISDEQTRAVTVMTTTMIPCSAKLPIITVIVATFFHRSALVATSMYIMGIVMILISGIILKKIKGATGEPAPFMMELPVYHCPAVRNIATSVVERSWSFVKKAGTFILLATVVVWALSSYSFSLEFVTNQNDSVLADFGHAITWIFLPNGFGNHWEMSVGVITGLFAKENLLGTLAVLMPNAISNGEGFVSTETFRAFCTSAEAMSFLIFNLLCAPCFAAISAMKRELGWRRTGFAVFYLCAMAYVVSMCYYNFATALGGDVHVSGMIASVACLAVIAYFLIAKDPIGTIRKKTKMDGGSRE